jgi:hypothetical protein
MQCKAQRFTRQANLPDIGQIITGFRGVIISIKEKEFCLQ